MGGSHREASRLDVRTSAIEELAQDEVRADAELCRWRLHRRSRRTRRTRGTSRRLLRGRRFCFRGEGWHRVRYELVDGTSRAPRQYGARTDTVHQGEGTAAT